MSATPLPETMRQVACAGAGGAEVMRLEQAPVPQPRSGELLIRVAAAGINRPDLFQRQGAYPPPADASPVLGLEVAGEIVALGPSVHGHQLGDRVCALSPGGGYAEYCRVPAAHALPIPSPLTLVQAAALPETFFTVWGNVFLRGRLQPGETLLVHGGNSGIGTTAVQLASRLGASVFATVRGAAKAAACAGLGAGRIIDTETEDFVEVVRAATAGRGADVVLDMLGGDTLPRNLDVLAIEGRLVFIAFLRGSTAKLDLQPIQRKRLTVTGSTLRPQSDAAKAAIAEALRTTVWPLLERGEVAPRIDRVFPFAEVVAAHRHLEAGTHTGKVVLRMDPPG